MQRLISDPNCRLEQIHAGRWATLAVLCLSLLVVVVDNSIVNVALPTLARQLHASTTSLQWVVDSYTLATAGLLLTLGSLGDRIGLHRTLAAGLLIFGLGSVLAALSGSAAQLIAFRAMMGIGAAAIMPGDAVHPDERIHGRQGAGEGHRALVRRDRPRRCDRSHPGRLAARALQLGLDIHGERADRGRGPYRRAVRRSAFCLALGQPRIRLARCYLLPDWSPSSTRSSRHRRTAGSAALPSA